MQSLATQPVTRQKPLEIHGLVFSRGNIFPSDWVCYHGLHLATCAAESNKYTYLTSGVDMATAAVVNRLEFKCIFR
jgi:hypothetical protein